MADNKDRKVGVYGDDTTTEAVEPTQADTTTTETHSADEKEGGGIPSWVIALIVVALIILAIILLF